MACYCLLYTSQVGQSPVSIADLDLLKKTVLFGEEDEKNLRLAGEAVSYTHLDVYKRQVLDRVFS